MPETSASTIDYGVTPTEIMASMPGIDFVRAIFAGKLPEPPIMQTIEPFDCTAEPGIVVLTAFPASGTTIRSARCMAAMPPPC